MKRYKLWDDAELEWLKSHYGELTPHEMARPLGRLIGSVRHKMRTLGLKPKFTRSVGGKVHLYRLWTPAEEKLVRMLGKRKVGITEIARRLNRSRSAIYCQLRDYGLLKPRPYATWTKKELNFLMFKCETMSISELAVALGRSVTSVSIKMTDLGYRALCGVYSLKAACEATGYEPMHFHRAKVALNYTWKKVSGRWVILPSQLRRMCNWLRDEGNNNAAPSLETAQAA